MAGYPDGHLLMERLAMPQAWSAKRERQYEHIKSGAQDHGVGGTRAAEIAARTVNKNRARSGEARQASQTSLNNVSPQHRGGKRSPSGPGGPTKAQLYNEARQCTISRAARR
jgi:hypothetical protein